VWSLWAGALHELVAFARPRTIEVKVNGRGS